MLEKFKFSDKEIDTLCNSMVILVDTREQENAHITDVFDKNHIPYKTKALSYGDYSFFIPKNEELNIPRDLYFDGDIIVERKGSLEEISGNLTNGRDRIEKEFALAPKNKVLMIENATYEAIALGHYNTKYNKKSFLASLHSFWFKYDLPFMLMPDKSMSALFIKKYFEYYLRNNLRKN